MPSCSRSFSLCARAFPPPAFLFFQRQGTFFSCFILQSTSYFHLFLIYQNLCMSRTTRTEQSKLQDFFLWIWESFLTWKILFVNFLHRLIKQIFNFFFYKEFYLSLRIISIVNYFTLPANLFENNSSGKWRAAVSLFRYIVSLISKKDLSIRVTRICRDTPVFFIAMGNDKTCRAHELRPRESLSLGERRLRE